MANGLNHDLGLIGLVILSNVHSIKLKGIHGISCITQLISQGLCFSGCQR
jgi:hypothetical protein